MMRNFVAFGVLALAGALFCLPEQAVAAGGMRGGMSGFRGPGIIHAPRMTFRPAHRAIAPHSVSPRSPRAFGTIQPSTPFGTIKSSGPFGTVRASRPFGTVGPAPRVPRFARIGVSHPRAHLSRRHHRDYFFGWGFPITYGDDSYIGVPYDPTEAVPVYGPAPAEPDDQDASAPPPPPRYSATRGENGNACSSEKVTVPATSGGDREITVVRC